MDWFEPDVRELEQRVAAQPLPKRGVAFYGSSSIRLWPDLAGDFPGEAVLNLGFGGSTLEACAWFFDRIVPRHEPSALVVYAGDNDLGDGQAPEQVLESYRRLHGLARERLGPVPIAFLSIKPSLARWLISGRIRRANDLIRSEVEGDPRARFVDLYPRMLDAAGRPRRELLAEDGLHLSEAGYGLWREVVREHSPFIFSRDL